MDDGSKVVIWGCNQNPWQQWIYTDDGLLTLANNTSTFLIQLYLFFPMLVLTSNSDLCLEVPGSSTANGVQVQTYPCNGGLNQVWKLV